MNLQMIVNPKKRPFILQLMPLLVAMMPLHVQAESVDGLKFSDIRVHRSQTLDADTIETKRIDVSISAQLQQKTRVTLSLISFSIDADPDSGLRATDIGEGESVNYYYPQLDLRMPVHNTIYADIGIGNQTTDTLGETVNWKAAMDGYFFNSLYARIAAEHSLYAVSPLAISRDIEHTATSMEFSWATADYFNIDAFISQSDFSDGNERRYRSIHPQWVAQVSDSKKYSFGIKAIDISFDQDLANGYYDPQQAQKYLLTAKATIKRQDSGDWILSAAAGQRKDDRINVYDEALEFSAIGRFKPHPDYDLELRAVVVGEGSGQFDPYWWGELALKITARF